MANHNKCKQQNGPTRIQSKSVHVTGFASDWLSRWREFINQSQNVVKQNQSNFGLLSTLKWKPLYFDQFCIESEKIYNMIWSE